MSDNIAELGTLVDEMWQIRKYHWETCVATGNLYSKLRDRPRAISYFKRFANKHSIQHETSTL